MKPSIGQTSCRHQACPQAQQSSMSVWFTLMLASYAESAKIINTRQRTSHSNKARVKFNLHTHNVQCVPHNRTNSFKVTKHILKSPSHKPNHMSYTHRTHFAFPESKLFATEARRVFWDVMLCHSFSSSWWFNKVHAFTFNRFTLKFRYCTPLKCWKLLTHWQTVTPHCTYRSKLW